MGYLPHRSATLLLAATGLWLGACQPTDRNGHNEIRSAPDIAVQSESTAVPPAPEPPIGSATHP